MNNQNILYGICIVILVLQIVAISTNSWSSDATSSVGSNAKAHFGLWKDSDGNHLPPTDSKNFPKNSLYACRAFSILGVLLVFAAYMNMMMKGGTKRMQIGLLMAGGVCSLIAMAVWAAELLNLKNGSLKVKFSPGYSFYLNMLGGAGALCVAAYMKYAK